MRDDLKAAFRSLKSSKTFTIVALLVLALGIGASTAIFSVVDAVVLRGMPFDEHDRLVAVGERRKPDPNFPSRAPQDPRAVQSWAPQNFTDVVAEQQVFASIAGIAGGAFTLREPGTEPEELRAQRVTASFFTVLREQPRLGRAFGVENETDGQERLAVLSDGLWRRRFGGDPDIVGKTIPIEGGAYEVIGVMGPEFEYPIGSVRPTELWVPYVVPADERIRNPRTMSIYLQGIARLKAGVSIEQAQANLDQIAAALTEAHPQWNKDTLLGVRPLRDHIVGAETRKWMMMLLGAVGLVLLIACANVANLLLARASAREREVGIRAAMGAGRWRLMRQLMVESLVLSGIGMLLGLLLAWWAVGVLKASMPEGVPRIASIAVDLRVLGAAAALSLVTGMLFGVVPALQLSRPDLTNALKDGARGASTGGARRRLRSALVVAEVALAVILLVGAALFIGSFRALMKIDPGFDARNLLTVGIQPRIERNVTGGQLPDYSRQVQEIVDHVARAPGVRFAGAISGGMPLGGSMSITGLTIPGRTLDGPDGHISIRRVTPDYHEAMGMPLRGGRHFEASDREGAAPVVIINESAAKKYFPGESAVGRTLGVNGERTVVGVVGDVYQSSLETEPRTEAYVPIAQGRTIFSELVVKTTGDPYGVVPAVKSAVLAAMPDVPLRNVRTMEELMARRTAQRRLNMLLLGLFGLLGLVISAVGIYGVMAYVVSQRTREIGVRMALGATRGTVIGMVLRNAGLLVAAGLVIGGAGAWFLAETAKSFLFRMDVNDPRAFAAALGALALAALVASVIPARRAASVDPMIALRSE
ncbi:MAG TPA: ABC transporter permease [Vicinamibacterales bacterium]|nr:ABC transporter permease [Vicinamibacterales bacterium]